MVYQARTATTLRPDRVSYLILQGLGSPFFKEVADLLSADGNSVHKVNFCGGDWWFSGGATNHRFNGKHEALEGFYRRLIAKHHISTLLIFGDCRPIHKVARAVADDLGITLWVFEEGYTRPGFITCEKNGTNDLSTLPRNPAQMRQRAAEIDEPQNGVEGPNLPNPMPRRVRMDIAHHFWNIILKPLYFRYRTHRPDGMREELAGWAARLKRGAQNKDVNAALVKRYEAPNKPFFMVPLQLNSDFQIREHSDYEGVLDFIRETVASFAKNAPKKALLMFKGHPLDNGMIDYRSYISMAAINQGVDGRVDFLNGGDLDLFLDHTAGVVLINSTVGYAALKKNKPMKVMGRALYNMPGLTDQQPLDKFWKKPATPDTALISDFLKVVINDSQIAGDFFTSAGIKMAAKGTLIRIKTDTQQSSPEKNGEEATDQHEEPTL